MVDIGVTFANIGDWIGYLIVIWFGGQDEKDFTHNYNFHF